jgi:hypothetical protein
VVRPSATGIFRFPTRAFAVGLLFCFLGGCAGGSGSPQSVTHTYTISGAISPSSGGSGSTLSLSGPAAGSTTADSSGNYSFTGLANGTYAVSPTHSGYNFNPSVQTVTINGSNVTGVDFAATQQTSNSVALSWVASTSVVLGYNIYRGTVSGGPYTKINPSLVSALNYTDTAVTSGNIYYYVCASVDSAGLESIHSNQVTAQIP